MKKGLRTVVVLILFVLTYLFPKTLVLAQASPSCSSFVASVNGSVVTIEAGGCRYSDGGELVTVLVHIHRAETGDDVGDAITLDIQFGQGKNQTNLTETGNYKAVFYGQSSSGPIQIGEKLFEIKTLTPPSCGMPCSQGSTNCPAQCPCITSRLGWFCGEPPQPDYGPCNNDAGIQTALGCIPKDINELAGWVFSNLIYVATGIAFLLMTMGAIMVLTSSGTPEKIKAGKELITSALSGLLFIILSLFILRLIGVDILQIPGFTK